MSPLWGTENPEQVAGTTQPQVRVLARRGRGRAACPRPVVTGRGGLGPGGGHHGRAAGAGLARSRQFLAHIFLSMGVPGPRRTSPPRAGGSTLEPRPWTDSPPALRLAGFSGLEFPVTACTGHLREWPAPGSGESEPNSCEAAAPRRTSDGSLMDS